MNPKRSSLLRGLGRSIDYKGKGAQRSSVGTPTPARVLRGCNVLLPKGALRPSFTVSPQQVCPCPVTSAPQGRGQTEEFIPPPWAPASQLAPNALMPTQGPQSAQPFSSTSQQAAPFQLFLRRERQEEKRWSWPSLHTSLVHLWSPQVHGLFPIHLSQMQTHPCTLAAPLLPTSDPSARLFVGTLLHLVHSKRWFPSLQS